VRDVLFISYLFPPMGGGGVQRTLSFVEGLPAHGWRPTVICAGPDAPYWAKDPSLKARVPKDVSVRRVPEGPLGWSRTLIRRVLPGRLRKGFDDRFLIPDRAVPWLPTALAAASRERLFRNFSAIYTTGAPWTDHMVGLLSVPGTSLPWVADFRDPWTLSAGAPIPEATLPIHQWLERRVYANADRIIANTRTQQAELEEAFPVARGKTTHIPNGWRDQDFPADLPEPDPDRLLLGYAGSLYPGYTARPLLERLERLQEELAPPLTLRWVGKTKPWDEVATSPIPAEQLGYLSQGQALRHMAECRAVFFFVPDRPHAEGWVPQKLYVYLRLGRPILAVGRDGEAMQILRDAKGPGLCLHPDDPNEKLFAWLRRLAAGELDYLGYDPSVVARYDRRQTTASLARLLDEIAAG
jgi:glycosyltransferase involved in cell wall biosynthesis